MVAAAAPLRAIDLDDRWYVRDYFNALYPVPANLTMEWSGNYAAGNAGAVSVAWREATRQRLEFFRAMAGVPVSIEFDPEFNALAQQAALMMSVAGALSHTPDASWPWYTTGGALAAEKSNLAIGRTGPHAVEGYIDDFGGRNSNVGHRRWILFPQTTVMGTGDAPGRDPSDSPPLPANALWVIPDQLEQRPPTREPFVAWPPPGHIPANLVFARWSFSHPGADFTQATVQMARDGQPLPATLEPLDTRLIGEPTLVWVPQGRRTDISDPWPMPLQDVTVQVSIGNVRINGQPQDFDYSVTIFNPGIPGPEEFAAVPTALDPPVSGTPVRFSVSSRPWSEGVQARVIRADSATEPFGAENQLDGMAWDTSPGYTPVQSTRVASGVNAYHLVMPEPVSQYLLLADTFVIQSGSATIQFRSSLAWATAGQVARLEVNTGDSDNWQPLWSARGPVENNDAFELITIPLADFDRRTARFRFHYLLESGNYYFQTEPWLGWAIDDIAFSGVDRAGKFTLLDPVWNGDSFTFPVLGTDPVLLQTRDLAFGGHPLDWGPITPIQPEVLVVAPPPGTWSRHPVFGLSWGADDGWAYTPALGWIYIASLPWIHDGHGWQMYVAGTSATGIWLYDPGHGFQRATGPR
jgi:hypothetical protein